MLRAERVDERDMLLVDEQVRALRVLDLWLDPEEGQLVRVDSHDVETDDLAEVHAWVVRPGRTTAQVSEVYRPVEERSAADRGRFALVGRYRLTPHADSTRRPRHRSNS
ncbi:hypothetical protein V6N00_05335 [Tersicoccus sp. MR15.9]|uniref:hypothetical protein n=1 Tax=Tersicoccus mangrovi TaxID=3121635 RepID=UPI002FE5B2EE